jgi:restriction system protein
VTIPDFQTVMRPILALLADGSSRLTKQVIAAMTDEFSLTDEERNAMLPSGRQRRMDNRVYWALTHLSQAGLLERPVRAHVRITAAGRGVLAAHPQRVDMTVLRQYPSYQEFRNRTSQPTVDKITTTGPVEVPEEQVSPQDLVSRALLENQAAVEGELLTRALALDPTDFEKLVIRLLEAMGYGRLGTIEHSGKSGDGGIDGIISQDPLGLDRIYLQAKRYTDKPVDRPFIQGFVGALMGAQGDRGVFLTTSNFTAGARAEAERVNARIVLIDGRRLAELMVRHGVGVQAETVVTLHQVDEDFFETL